MKIFKILDLYTLRMCLYIFSMIYFTIPTLIGTGIYIIIKAIVNYKDTLNKLKNKSVNNGKKESK